MSTKAPECWASDASAQAVRIETSPGKSLLLKFDHLVYAEFEISGNEQSLQLHFATHDVIIRGHALRRIETALQRQELSFLMAVPATYRAGGTDGQPAIHAIEVTVLQPGTLETE